MTTTDPSADLIAQEIRLAAAMQAADVAALDALIADDVLFVTPAGQLLSKADDLDAYRSGRLRVTQLEVLERQIRSIPNGALVVTHCRLGGTFAGTPFAGTFRYTRVWQHAHERWHVVGGHGSAVT